MPCLGSPIPFLFSSFTVAILASKTVHLVAHFPTVPLSAFILYLPTFFFFDVLAIFVLRLLLQTARGGFFLIGVVLGGFISCVDSLYPWAKCAQVADQFLASPLSVAPLRKSASSSAPAASCNGAMRSRTLTRTV